MGRSGFQNKGLVAAVSSFTRHHCGGVSSGPLLHEQSTGVASLHLIDINLDLVIPQLPNQDDQMVKTRLAAPSTEPSWPTAKHLHRAMARLPSLACILFSSMFNLLLRSGSLNNSLHLLRLVCIYPSKRLSASGHVSTKCYTIWFSRSLIESYKKFQ